MKRGMIAQVLAVATLLLFCPDANAASPTEQLRELFSAATRILDDPDPERTPEERLIAIRAIVRESFDVHEAAQLSLGPAWGARTAAEQAEFETLFADLLERSLTFGIASRIRLADGVQVNYLGESIDGGQATVRTAIMSRSGLDLPFHYKMVERGDGWAVRDVVIDGVSLAANYRAQFLRVIQGSSYEDLVRHMRARVSGTPVAPTLTVADVEEDHPATPVAPEPRALATVTEPISPTPSDALVLETTVGTQAISNPHETVAIAFVELEPMPSRPTFASTSSPAIERPDPLPSPPVSRSEAPSEIRTAVAPRPPSSATTYWVQVGAFANADVARRLASLLRQQESPASPDRWVVTDATTTKPSLARVRMGPFTARAEAASRLRELQAHGYQPFIAEERD